MSWTVAQVMTKDVVTAAPETGFKACADLMRIHGVSALPVIDGIGRVLGVVSESDLLAKEAARGAERHMIELRRKRRRSAGGRIAADVMTSPAITAGPTTTVPQAARLMHARRVKRLPVVDAYGILIGIVSRSDLLKTFLRSDEAIRREVVDQVLNRLFVDPEAVDVEVTAGVVHLRGEVETRSLSDLIARHVAAIEGTVGVENLLRFRLDDIGLGIETPPRALQLAAPERAHT